MFGPVLFLRNAIPEAEGNDRFECILHRVEKSYNVAPSVLSASPRVSIAFCGGVFPLYICSDLVGMYAHENMVNLTRYALPLEDFVSREEEQSARLEATLLPQYRANGEWRERTPAFLLPAF